MTPNDKQQTAWNELQRDQDAVFKYYLQKEQAIPKATLKRLNKQLFDFKCEWQDYKPTVEELKKWHQIIEPDTSKFNSLTELKTAHNAIKEARAGQDLPDATKSRMEKEFKEYWTEIQVQEYRSDSRVLNGQEFLQMLTDEAEKRATVKQQPEEYCEALEGYVSEPSILMNGFEFLQMLTDEAEKRREAKRATKHAQIMEQLKQSEKQNTPEKSM